MAPEEGGLTVYSVGDFAGSLMQRWRTVERDCRMTVDGEWSVGDD